MKKWSEVKSATLDKLFLDENEARIRGYLARFETLANECLNFIANGVKPKIVRWEIDVVDNAIFGTDFKYDLNTKQLTYMDVHGNNVVTTPKCDTIYVQKDGKHFTYKNNEWIETDTTFHINDTISMPEDFISFADLVNYYNNEPGVDLVYLSDRDIKVDKSGSYVIFYNALYHNATKEDIIDDVELDAPQSVLNCLPSYIASQLLAQDDIQRSASLKNEFEVMLARLDTDIMYQEKHFKSTGGWY